TTALPPAIPFTSQVIAVPGARQNVAAKLCVCPSAKLTALGAIVFALEQVIVTPAFPNFAASATLVALTITVAGDGGVAGAIETAVCPPSAAIVPAVVLPPAIPFTLQVTAESGLPVPVTPAVNTCAP